MLVMSMMEVAFKYMNDQYNTFIKYYSFGSYFMCQ